MDIHLDKVSKRYTTGWVLKDITVDIPYGSRVSITGPNGSGKSTLLQIIAGYLSYTQGAVSYIDKNSTSIDRDDIYKHCAISAAYMELDEELTVEEIYAHYQIFKNFKVNKVSEFLDLVDLQMATDKQIRYFSSGMKQRLNVGLALAMDTPLIFLDEPTSFLDEGRKTWYTEVIQELTQGHTLIIASNDESDIASCKQNIHLQALQG